MSQGKAKAKTSGTKESGRLQEAISGLTTETEQLKLDQAAINKIIEDVLGGAQGLASIFQGEQTAGIFDSSTSAQAAGNLAAKLAGEIAKITGETVRTVEEDRTRAQRTSGKSRTTSFEAEAKLFP